MKRGAKKNSGVWQYLLQTGVLERGTGEEIEAARRAYWQEYKRNWKHAHQKRYTVSLSVAESGELVRAAKAHRSSPTRFIRQALFAYIRSEFVFPDQNTLQEIRLLLAKNYLLLQEFQDQDLHAAFGKLVAQMDHLEQEILHQLLHPASLETLLKAALANSPETQTMVQTLLEESLL